MTRYFVDAQANYLGGYDGAEPPNGAVEVFAAPAHASQKWANDRWSVAPPPDRVTSRQFKMQLEKDGLLSSVEAWIGQQSKLVQIAYQNSGTFVRTEPMMQAGFAALRFTSEQADAFFKAASAL